MKRNSFSNVTLASLTSLAFLMNAAQAQENGYVNGSGTLFSFSPSTGAIVGSSTVTATAEPLAVAGNDSRLYLIGFGSLYSVVGKTGEVAGYLPISGLEPRSVALTKDGTTAYVATSGGVSVIDTATFSIVGSIAQIGPAYDVALSPDDSTLYMSVDCSDACPPPSICKVEIGVCAFNRSTLALKWQVKNIGGLLSVSNDGSYVYVAAPESYGKPGYPLNAINTSTQAVTNLGVSEEKDMEPLRIITDPASTYAVVFEQSAYTGVETPASAYLLNTFTNKFVGTLFSTAPGGMAVTNSASAAAFAPDGKSVWMLLSCRAATMPNCSDESQQIYLAGFSLPSGAAISYQALPGEVAGNSDQSLAFPR